MNKLVNSLFNVCINYWEFKLVNSLGFVSVCGVFFDIRIWVIKSVCGFFCWIRIYFNRFFVWKIIVRIRIMGV